MVEAAATAATRSTDLASPRTDAASMSSPPTDPSTSGDASIHTGGLRGCLNPLHPRVPPLDHPCVAAADGAWCSTAVTGAAGWSTVGRHRWIQPSPTAGEPATPLPLSAPGLRTSGPCREAGHAREAAPPLRNAAPPADEAEPPHLLAERPPRRAPPPCQEE
ncbi:uncharacterized protein [Miscanthus floridulus]|uniref:uncharacterized protein n=1 Tax=Miscanthus floridulus TaxID=154761 RepID=UPI003457FF8F